MRILIIALLVSSAFGFNQSTLKNYENAKLKVEGNENVAEAEFMNKLPATKEEPCLSVFGFNIYTNKRAMVNYLKSKQWADEYNPNFEQLFDSDNSKTYEKLGSDSFFQYNGLRGPENDTIYYLRAFPYFHKDSIYAIEAHFKEHTNFNEKKMRHDLVKKFGKPIESFTYWEVNFLHKVYKWNTSCGIFYYDFGPMNTKETGEKIQPVMIRFERKTQYPEFWKDRFISNHGE